MGKVKAWRWTAVKAVVNLAILLLQFDFNSCQGPPPFIVLGTVSGNVSLSPSNTKDLMEVTWKKGKNKVIEWDSDGVKSYPPFDGRVHLGNASGDLHISNLTSSDEGEYEVEMLPSLTGMKFKLIVFDPLPSPTLQCGLVNESIEVLCGVPESYSRHREKLTYSWHCSSPQCGESTTPVLHLKNDDLSEKVLCSASNTMSNRTSSIVLSTCVPPDKLRHRYLLIATVAVVLVAISGFVCCCWKPSRRGEATISS
ncbi:lymphocyte function-associated antigen 3 [Phyllostomus hastatus]|uniref:lymphocyte function-associated antigen 3 n=1 Tax=Phyllostomus hastatus TaxID=9423 RepID=UPI001E684500|nr:lymphocyte function-associated antigen 3 [Phyllostomus hastatus]